MRIALAILALLLAACGSAPTAQQTVMTLRPTLILTDGQSNGIGPDSSNPPAGLPDATIPYLQRDYHYFDFGDSANTWGSLAVSTHAAAHSHTLQFAKRLKAAGFPTAAASLCQGATFINRWPPGAAPTTPGGRLYADLAANVKPHMDALYPTGWDYIWVWDQGEEEARYNDLPTVQAWSDYYALIKAGVTSSMGQAPILSFVLRTYSNIGPPPPAPGCKTFPGVLEAEQQGVTDSITSFCIDTNDGTFEGDNVHRTGLFQNTLGDRMADIAIPLITPVEPPPPPNSLTFKATIFEPALSGMRLTMGGLQTQQWPPRAAGSIYRERAPGMRLDMMNIVSTSSPTAAFFQAARPDRIGYGYTRVRR